MSHDGKSINLLWDEFKGALQSGIEQFVPQRTVSSKPSLPWITQELKRSIRMRDSLYNKYKRLRSPSDRHAFVEARHLVKHKLKQVHNTYIEDILGLTGTSEQSEPHCQSSSETNNSTYASKKLFSLLKDSKGSTLLKKDGKLYSDTVDKANILNNQFQSVFTPKSPLKLSQLAYMTVQDLSDRGATVLHHKAGQDERGEILLENSVMTMLPGKNNAHN